MAAYTRHHELAIGARFRLAFALRVGYGRQPRSQRRLPHAAAPGRWEINASPGRILLQEVQRHAEALLRAGTRAAGHPTAALTLASLGSRRRGYGRDGPRVPERPQH